jgi:hypothetical protein
MAESNIRVLLVTFNRIEGIDVDMLAAAFNKGLDWTILNDNSFLIKTISDAQRWYGRIEPLLGDTHTVFICRVDLTDRQGFLPKQLWDWIDAEARSASASPPALPFSFSELSAPPKKP